ncbi:hypothetical protein pb186bvf_015768 [Paramecium bursaria]
MRILLISFLIGCSFCLSTRTTTAKKIEDLRSTKFGRTVLNLITLHSGVNGPINELIEAIDELIDDLSDQLEQLDFTFQQRTNEHNSYIVFQEQSIRDAEQDIARIEDVIDNLLIPRRDQIQQKVETIGDNIDYNRKSLEEENLIRQQDNEAFQNQIIEFNEAIEAVDDAITLIAQLQNPTLLQLKHLKKTIQKIPTKAWNYVNQGPLAQALLQMAVNMNFADPGILKEIVDALNDFRNEVVSATNDATQREAENQEEFEQKVEQLGFEYAEFQRQLNAQNIELTATQQKLEDSIQFQKQRQFDLQQYTEQLNLENETFAVETDIYQSAKDNYTRELQVAEEGLAVVKSADFSNINI